ncbi:hypothetical protein N8D55_18215 [Xanthomonas hortorum pv. pelargonii]|nr:hypothetical protein N8D55_18215 [Xanthomonas hortorum pv. pelargonii]
MSPTTTYTPTCEHAMQRCFSLSVGLAACSQPPATSNAVTPAEALCALLPNTPDADLPTDRRDESMQQLDLATRCNSALRRHR